MILSTPTLPGTSSFRFRLACLVAASALLAGCGGGGGGDDTPAVSTGSGSGGTPPTVPDPRYRTVLSDHASASESRGQHDDPVLRPKHALVTEPSAAEARLPAVEREPEWSLLV